MIELTATQCKHLPTLENQEWLVTNGIGGYGSGTVAGTLTRRYHGILVAALNPPLGRTLLLTKLDDSITYNGQLFHLFNNHWASGYIEPSGFHYLKRFHLEGSTPVWTFACADALIEKRIWMQPGQNTTYIHYTLTENSTSLALTVKTILNYRDYHGTTRAADFQNNSHMEITPIPYGLQVKATPTATPFYLLSYHAKGIAQHDWYCNYYLNQEVYRGFEGVEDHYRGGSFASFLHHIGETFTLVVSTNPTPNLDGVAAYAERQAYEKNLLKQQQKINSHFSITIPNWIKQLTLAADQFIVRRSLPEDTQGHSILAGYPWFSDWGRDTMISLPGLTLVTGRPQVAKSILKTYARFVNKGMLPNRFPDEGETPEYNTVDATLWYFEAIRAYYASTHDDLLLEEIFPVLQEIIAWHQKGTRYQIHLDNSDGLIYAGESGSQLTWMDAKVGDWVVTPRTGKPIEINALWYNALCITINIATILKQPTTNYKKLAQKAKAGFARFWNKQAKICYDVIDTPNGVDSTLRPNQLFAVSLPHSPLSTRQQKAVVNACTKQLLTPHGLRSLAPNHPNYQGIYGGDQRTRDGSYHQGTVWAWLIGPFIKAHLRVYKNPTQASTYLEALTKKHLFEHGLGSISEIFDGDAPFTPRGCIAQAWSVAAILEAWQAIKNVERGT